MTAKFHKPSSNKWRFFKSLLVITFASVILCASGSSVPETPETPEANRQVVDLSGSLNQPIQAAKEPLVPSPEVAKADPSDTKAKSTDEKTSTSGSGETIGADADAAAKRKGRAETSALSEPANKPETSKTPAVKSTEKSSSSSATSSSSPATSPAPIKSSETSTSESKSKPTKGQASSKSAPKTKLPANLGTVTSTGSGGPSHYMSKHDAYSAIAEKHGALGHEPVSKKADKRSQLSSFGGIQKASGGIGDMLSPFKGVTDSGLARTLGASMRSIIKGKYSVPAYVASAVLSAVALMTFYESPISPLPVPALPEPPIGRFPPEMPNISPNIQVPFRTNQQQQQQYGQNNYQRSFNPQQQQFKDNFQQLGNQQQVVFPNAQQRQMTVGAPASNSPVQNLAANLLSTVGAKPQVAQRKSSPDYDQSSSRSFFGSSAVGSAQGQQMSQKVDSPSNPQKSNSFLSYFGFGSSPDSTPAKAQSPALGAQVSSVESKANQPASSASTANSNLSGSHLVNKVKSLFSRSPAPVGGSSSASVASANSNQYDQYQRMSFVQALMKDAAFLPGYLSPTRKSSQASASQSVSSSGKSSASIAPPQQTATQSSSSASASIGPAARMQVGPGEFVGSYATGPQFPMSPIQSQPAANQQKSGYGLVKAADRIAHALLETFSSGIMQRHAAPTALAPAANDNSARKSVSNEEVSPLVSATSLLTDIMSNYNTNLVNEQQQQPQQHEPQAKSADISQSSTSASSKDNQLSARSLEVAAPEQSANQNEQKQSQSSKVTNESNVKIHQSAQPESQSVSSPVQSPQASVSQAPGAQGHVRKTRSIGLEYPIETNQMLAQREQQPSKATQINNVIDFVADSYSHNRMLFNFVMNQVGLSHAVPYVEQILGSGKANEYH